MPPAMRRPHLDNSTTHVRSPSRDRSAERLATTFGSRPRHPLPHLRFRDVEIFRRSGVKNDD
ncbi:hypothetical protein MINT15_13310 [Saccharomonospora viridis]|uniref:Uncharacterized protein n=1 Tax=Saccharomonospora viridis TaxID=1852 RepID=A0A837D9A4_9PSEU|nr:hypothetical protein MINT15_13310 [Saccharomonospora viridis]